MVAEFEGIFENLYGWLDQDTWIMVKQIFIL